MAKRAMPTGEYISDLLFGYLPEGMKGEIAARAYLGDYFFQDPRSRASRTLVKRIMRSPGVAASMQKYLYGEGRNHVKDIVGRELSGKWYKKPVQMLVDNPIGRGFAISRILEKSLPTYKGSPDLALAYLRAGGTV